MKKDATTRGQDQIIPTYLGKIIKAGNSYAIVIPKNIVEKEALEVGDTIIVKLAKRFAFDYKCGMCGYHFNSDEDFPYCPACDEENNLLVLEDVQ